MPARGRVGARLGSAARAMIDLHSHVLHGVDDGPSTLQESVAMLETMARDGVRIVAATPHVREDYPTTAETIERGVAQLNTALAAAAIEIDVRAGGELAAGWIERLEPAELARYGLGGQPGALLVEFPYLGWSLELGGVCSKLVASGIVPVLAHPERNDRVQADPARVEEYVRRGALVQLTASSLTGRRGSRSRTAALQLLELGLAHLVSTDAHGPPSPESRLSAVAHAVRNDSLASWLTRDVPAALLAGTALPQRPSSKRLGVRGWRLGRYWSGLTGGQTRQRL